MAGGDLDIAQADPGVQHGRDERVPEHVGMWPGDPHARVPGQVAQAAGGGVPVHPGAAAVEQDRPAGAARDGAVDGPADRRGQRDQDDLGALAADPQDPVAVFLAQVLIRPGGRCPISEWLLEGACPDLLYNPP